MNSSFNITLFVVLAVYAVMGAGAFCGKIGWLNAETRQSLLSIVIKVLMPCLIVKNILMNPVFQDPSNLYGPPLIGFGIIFAGTAMAWLAGLFLPQKLTTLDSRRKIGTFAACLGMLNYGYVPIPLIDNLFPGDRGILGILFVQNLGTEIALWTICVFSFTGKFDRKTLKSLISIPLMVLIACILFNVINPIRWIPNPWLETCRSWDIPLLFWKPIDMLAPAAIPLSLLCVGGAIAEQFRISDFTEDFGKTFRLASLSIFLRLFVLPILILGSIKFLPCSQETKCVTVIYASMSSATFPIVLSEIYGGDVKTALLTSLSNSFAAILTTPVWIIIGLKWIG